MVMRFEIGDKVKITDTGGTYTTYVEFVDRHDLDKFEYGYGFEHDDEDYEEFIKTDDNYCTIVASDSPKGVVGLYVHKLDKHIIIDVDCIQHTNERPHLDKLQPHHKNDIFDDEHFRI